MLELKVTSPKFCNPKCQRNYSITYAKTTCVGLFGCVCFLCVFLDTWDSLISVICYARLKASIKSSGQISQQSRYPSIFGHVLKLVFAFFTKYRFKNNKNHIPNVLVYFYIVKGPNTKVQPSTWDTVGFRIFWKIVILRKKNYLIFRYQTFHKKLSFPK